MKQGITIERTCDLHDRPIVRITKRRGRLSLEEGGDLLRHEGFGEWWGHYAIVLNCTESTIVVLIVVLAKETVRSLERRNRR